MIPQRELVHGQKRAVVRQAEHFVGATDKSADRLIRAHFIAKPRPSLTRAIAERYIAVGGAGET